MPIATHIRELRSLVGSRLLLLPGVAAVVHDATGGVLLQRRSDDGTWSLPAGAIEVGETPQEAVVRETREETGLHVRPIHLLGVFGGVDFRHTYLNGDQVEYTVIVFECQPVGTSVQLPDEETLEVRFFPIAEMPALALPYPMELFRAGHARRSVS